MTEEISEGSGAEFPKGSVERFLSIEDQVRSYLDSIIQLQINSNYDEARKRIRNFGDPENDYADIFAVVMLSIKGVDKFFEDADEALDSEQVDRLHNLQDDYEELSDDFTAVYSERVNDTFNPINSYSWDKKYSGGDLLLKYKEKSGKMTVLETHDSPSEILDQARTRILSVRKVIDTAADQHDHNIGEDAREKYIELIEESMSELGRIRSLVTNMEDEND